MCQPGQAPNKNWGQGQLCKRVRNFRYCFGQHNLAVAGHKSSFYGSNNYVNSLNLYIPLRLHVLNSLDRLFVLWKGCNNRLGSGKKMNEILYLFMISFKNIHIFHFLNYCAIQYLSLMNDIVCNCKLHGHFAKSSTQVLLLSTKCKQR